MMNKFNKFLTIISVVIFTLVAGPVAVFAATDPGLGAAASFSVIGQTAITDVPTSSMSGNVGLNAAASNYSGLTAGEVAGTIYASNISGISTAILSPTVQANLSTAFTSTIPGQGSNGTIGPVLDGLVVTPGVYDIGAGRLNGGVLHLNGAGIYIFRASSDFISSGSIDLQNGARACDVYWNVQTLATINGSSFVGTILAGTGVHFGANVTLNGRALAVGGDVTLISDTISGPTCAVAPSTATLTLVKTIIGGARPFADFPLTATGPTTISGASASPAVTGATVTAGTYNLSEGTQSNYTAGTWSCIINSAPAVIGSFITLASGDTAICTVQNTFIPPPPPAEGSGTVAVSLVAPLIDLVKVPSPLSLPNGQGLVTYTYTIRNIGIVPMTGVTLTDNVCSPMVYVSGDANNDAKLDVNETWTYDCFQLLSTTQTNTATATGWANGISAIDIASATVIVGVPIVPPLIHVTKVPNPLALPAGSGMVLYTNKVTNPGTVPLSNVQLVDDKCGFVQYISGDTNGDSKLDPTETWTYICNSNLTTTTTNTVVATGQANGLTARDFALATVVVSAPRFPNTGFYQENNIWNIIVSLVILFVSILSINIIAKKLIIK
jgi:uncharacterized repeat protein (TIGR01451 family)